MVAIFLLVIGGVALVAGIVLLSISSKIRGWPVARGRIEERSVGPSTTTGASRPGRYFEPRVAYSYSVEGKTYTGRRIGPVTAAYDEDHARRVVDGLPDTVDVRYNPRNPGDAYLRPASSALAWLAIVAGALCAMSGVTVLSMNC
jgi:hypothetical protein